MLGHKTTINKFKKIEIISSIFFNKSGMKIEIKYRKKTGKNHKHVERKQHATKNISRSMEQNKVHGKRSTDMTLVYE